MEEIMKAPKLKAPKRKTKLAGRPLTPGPKGLTLLDVLRVVRSLAKSDSEAAAAVDYMLRSGSIRFTHEDALAA